MALNSWGSLIVIIGGFALIYGLRHSHERNLPPDRIADRRAWARRRAVRFYFIPAAVLAGAMIIYNIVYFATR